MAKLKNPRLILLITLMLLLAFAPGCSGSKAKKAKADKIAAEQKAKETKLKLEMSMKKEAAEKERLRREEEARKAEEQRLAEERRIREAEELRVAEEHYRAEEVKKTLGAVIPPPPPLVAAPTRPPVDASGDLKIIVNAGDLESTGPLDQPLAPLGPDQKAQGSQKDNTDSVDQSGAADQTARVKPGPADRAGDMTRNKPAPKKLITLVPFERAIPPLPKEPTLRVAVLGDLDQPEKSSKVALIIGEYNRESLESRLGMAVKIAYVAQLERNLTTQSAIHYRPNYFRAALTVASVLPQDQALSPMNPKELSQKDVDLIVYIGRDYR